MAEGFAGLLRDKTRPSRVAALGAEVAEHVVGADPERSAHPRHRPVLGRLYPDTRIKEHPINIGSGEWTTVLGVMEGTFTKPMPIGNGKEIPPTGKAFKLKMATVSHWKNVTIDEEYLFWDNLAFMKQVGLPP